MGLEGITRFCFGASYVVALILELAQTRLPRKALRWGAAFFGGAGIFAHTLFLLYHRPTVASPYGSLLLLAWVVGIFYLYGSLHYRGLAWAVFVLPIVLILIGLSNAFPSNSTMSGIGLFTGDRFWGAVHGTLLLLAAVGVCVGFVSAIMYLVQARRLRAKTHPGHGLRLLSLERLATMNRRAVNWAFPLLSAGLLVGVILMAQYNGPSLGWTAPRVIGTVGLWMSCLMLLVMRYAVHWPGRSLALLTIAVFVLLLFTLAASHPVVPGGGP
jgi:hypothetical protein